MKSLLESRQHDFTGGAIGGSDGIIWFSTPGFYPNSIEFKIMVKAFDQTSELIYTGFLFQNIQYSIIDLTKNMMIAECSGGNSLILLKNSNVFVFGFETKKILRDSCHKACIDIMNVIVNEKLYEQY